MVTAGQLISGIIKPGSIIVYKIWDLRTMGFFSCYASIFHNQGQRNSRFNGLLSAESYDDSILPSLIIDYWSYKPNNITGLMALMIKSCYENMTKGSKFQDY
jgi:hypothetical protein